MEDIASKSVLMVQDKHSSAVLQQLQTQRNCGKFCDVILKVFGQQYLTHANVLAAVSPYFNSFLLGQNEPRRFSPAAPQIVELQIDETGTSESYQSAIKIIIDYMYSGFLHISGGNILQVFQLSKVLQIEKLIELCSPHLLQLINVQKKVESSLESQCDVDTDQSPAVGVVDDNLKMFDLVLDICDDEKGETIDVEEKPLNGSSNKLQVVDNNNTGNSCPIKDAVVIKSEEKTQKTLLCSECPFTTTKPYRLSRHMTSHTGGKYMCKMCNFATTKLRELTAHNKVHQHMNNICSYCDFEAENGQEMRDHLEKHSGVLPYFCNYCDKRFKTRAQMNLHTPKHKDEKPFICKICSLGFKWKHALKGHYLVHTKEKNHLCDICGYATAHKSQLKAHHLIHTGELFSCTHGGCSYRTIKKQNLAAHILTHTREKPHQCDVCGQAFSLVKNMKRHMLLHSVDRPHHCTLCSFSTTRYDKLNEHMNKTHGAGKPIKKRLKVDPFVGFQQMSLPVAAPPVTPPVITPSAVNPHIAAPPVDSNKTVIESNRESGVDQKSVTSASLFSTGTDTSQVISVEQLNPGIKKTQILVTGDVTKLLQSVHNSNQSLETDNSDLIKSDLEVKSMHLESPQALSATPTSLVTFQPLQLVKIAFPSSNSDTEFK